MSNSDQSYSPFWAILVLLIGLTVFEGLQVYYLYAQASNTNKLINSPDAAKQLTNAVGAHNKLSSLAADVYALAQKGNPNAIELVQKFRISPNTAGTNAAPAAPAPAPTH